MSGCDMDQVIVERDGGGFKATAYVIVARGEPYEVRVEAQAFGDEMDDVAATAYSRAVELHKLWVETRGG